MLVAEPRPVEMLLQEMKNHYLQRAPLPCDLQHVPIIGLKAKIHKGFKYGSNSSSSSSNLRHDSLLLGDINRLRGSSHGSGGRCRWMLWRSCSCGMSSSLSPTNCFTSWKILRLHWRRGGRSSRASRWRSRVIAGHWCNNDLKTNWVGSVPGWSFIFHEQNRSVRNWR
jgi:hypothetical protein